MSKTLYERLGEEKGVTSIAKDIVSNHLVNPTIKTRFQDSDPDKLKRLVVEFICMGTGGPQQYSGMDMLTAHKGMNISEEEFIAVTDDVTPEAKNEVLGILYSLKGEIIRV